MKSTSLRRLISRACIKPALTMTLFSFTVLVGHAAPPADNPAEQRLPHDVLTMVEAKAFVRDYETERDQLQEARKAIFARGANATPEERGKLIEEFHANYGARMNALRAKAARAEDLGKKIHKAETEAKAGAK